MLSEHELVKYSFTSCKQTTVLADRKHEEEMDVFEKVAYIPPLYFVQTKTCVFDFYI